MKCAQQAASLFDVVSIIYMDTSILRSRCHWFMAMMLWDLDLADRLTENFHCLYSWAANMGVQHECHFVHRVHGSCWRAVSRVHVPTLKVASTATLSYIRNLNFLCNFVVEFYRPYWLAHAGSAMLFTWHWPFPLTSCFRVLNICDTERLLKVWSSCDHNLRHRLVIVRNARA